MWRKFGLRTIIATATRSSVMITPSLAASTLTGVFIVIRYNVSSMMLIAFTSSQNTPYEGHEGKELEKSPEIADFEVH